MAIWNWAWPKAAPKSTPAEVAGKSKQQIEALRLPIEDLGRVRTLRYPARGSDDRMYDAEGLEMRSCTVKIDRKGRGKIEYEDGETGTVRMEWIADA